MLEKLKKLAEWKWNLLNGKKTYAAAAGWGLYSLLGFVLGAQSVEQALTNGLVGLTILGLGHKSQKILDMLSKLKK